MSKASIPGLGSAQASAIENKLWGRALRSELLLLSSFSRSIGPMIAYICKLTSVPLTISNTMAYSKSIWSAEFAYGSSMIAINLQGSGSFMCETLAQVHWETLRTLVTNQLSFSTSKERPPGFETSSWFPKPIQPETSACS